MRVVGNLKTLNIPTFFWEIENFSSIDAAKGEPIYSPMFETTHLCAKKLTWRLQLFPAGVNEERKEYMGLFLRCLSECDVMAFYTLSALDDKHNTIFEFTPNEVSKFNKHDKSWGHNKFCSKTILHDKLKKELTNDTLMITCVIKAGTVSNSVQQLDEIEDGQNDVTAHFENLLERGVMSDVTFEIENKQIRLHKAIVTSLSPVFLAMFQHQMKEKEEGVVKITDVKYEVMKELFRYIYVRKVNDIESIADDLLVAADKYDVQGLRLMCEKILVQKLNSDNALQYLGLAVKYNATILKSKGIEFVLSRLEEFVDRPEFDHIDAVCKSELFRTIAKKFKYK